MKSRKRRFEQIKNYFAYELWMSNETDSPWLHKTGKGVLQRLCLTYQCFVRENLTDRASGLTYATLFSTVPLLAILFAIAKGFGLEEFIVERIRVSLAGQSTVADALIGFVNSYLAHTKGGVFVGFGILLLLYTLLNLTGNIERTFNQIWQVRRPRTPFRKMTDYTTIFFLLPLVAIVTGGITIFVSTFLKDLADIDVVAPAIESLMEWLPFVLMSVFFAAFYMFMPNTRVTLKSALVGGLPAGIAFQTLQFVYVHSQVWVSNYNAIYGSFAALPLFMLWCQCSWYICLMGATLSYVDQNLNHFYRGGQDVRVNRKTYNFLCLLLVGTICKRFAQGKTALSGGEIAKNLHLPIRLIKQILYRMCANGILTEVVKEGQDEGDFGFTPAMSLDLITAGKVLESLENDGEKWDDKLLTQTSEWKRYETMYRNYYAQDALCIKMHEF